MDEMTLSSAVGSASAQFDLPGESRPSRSYADSRLGSRGNSIEGGIGLGKKSKMLV
jgi:hypothetical protein